MTTALDTDTWCSSAKENQPQEAINETIKTKKANTNANTINTDAIDRHDDSDNESDKNSSSSSIDSQTCKSTTSAEYEKFTREVSQSIVENGNKGLKVLFLSSDTGGGHRASAESLAKQFEILFPGSTYDLLDIVEKDGVPPYSNLVSSYKHLSAHPSQWKLVYAVSNSRAFEMLADAHLKLMCERAVRRRIMSYAPDVVVSVHPLMTNVPVLSCSKISNETGRHLPIFTVVTDLGSAHCLWFANGVEKMFVGSDQIAKLARSRGKVPAEKIVKTGLPIRHDFAIQADKLGDRTTPKGKAYIQQVRQELELPHTDRHTILIMGGGEGVGSLSNIVEALYVELVMQGIDAQLLVVCGRNEKLKQKLEEKEWQSVVERWRAAKDRVGLTHSLLAFDEVCGSSINPMDTAGCIESGTVTTSLRRMLNTTMRSSTTTATTSPTIVEKGEDEFEVTENTAVVPSVMSAESINSVQGRPGQVEVVCLGFVNNMADYMVAANVLVTKAGPGTISEAAALGLPVMLTSFLPGQEEGNVDYVIDGGFGAFCSDSDPLGMAEELCMWLQDPQKLATLSQLANKRGAPHAARDIAKAIGESTLKWREHNEEIMHKQQQQQE